MSLSRNYAVDALKIIAAFGVVTIHLAPSTPGAEVLTRLFLIFSVPFFLLIALHFFIKRSGDIASIRFSELNIDRLLVPYATWTVIYSLLRLLKLRVVGKAFEFDFLHFFFYGGAALQLYYIPLQLMFQATVLGVILLFPAHKRRWRGALIATGAIAFGCWGETAGYLGFNDVLLSCVLYVGLAFLLEALQATSVGRRVNVATGCVLVGLLGYTALRGQPLTQWSVLQGPVAGYGVCALVLNCRISLPYAAVRWLMSCSYGIYLAHFGFLECLEFSADQFGLVLTPYSFISKLILGLLICALCVMFVVVVRLSGCAAYLLLGERSHFPGNERGACVRA